MSTAARAVRQAWAASAAVPVVPRYVVRCAVVFGTAGGIIGSTMGWLAYPPTAWFAILEVGIPSACLGALLGLVSALVRLATQRLS